MTLAYFNAPTHSQSTHTGAFTSVAWLDLFEGPHGRVQQHLSTSFLHLHNLALCVIPNVSALNFDLFKGVSSVWVTENTFRVVFGTDVNKQQKSECQSVVTQFVTVVHLPVVASTWSVCERVCVHSLSPSIPRFCLCYQFTYSLNETMTQNKITISTRGLLCF